MYPGEDGHSIRISIKTRMLKTLHSSFVSVKAFLSIT